MAEQEVTNLRQECLEYRKHLRLFLIRYFKNLREQGITPPLLLEGLAGDELVEPYMDLQQDVERAYHDSKVTVVNL